MQSEDNFITKIFQILTILTTVLGLLSQYFFRQDFFQILNIDAKEPIFNAFTMATLVFGVLTIIIIYSNRYYMLVKWYPNKKDEKRYIDSLRPVSDTKSSEGKAIDDITSKTGESSQPLIVPPQSPIEPFYLTLKNFGYILFIVAILLFFFIFLTSITALKLFCYLLFVLCIVYIATVFVLDLNFQNDVERKNKSAEKIMKSKLQSYFCPEFKIIQSYDLSLGNRTYYTNRVEANGKVYIAQLDKMTPDSYWGISEEVKP